MDGAGLTWLRSSGLRRANNSLKLTRLPAGFFEGVLPATSLEKSTDRRPSQRAA
jgi:hypothetical protein